MRTAEHVTLLDYKDSRGTYELLDDREVEHEQLAGTDDYILDEWGKKPTACKRRFSVRQLNGRERISALYQLRTEMRIMRRRTRAVSVYWRVP